MEYYYNAKVMREGIMKMAGEIKGFSPPPFEIVTAAPETYYSVKDAIRAFDNISGNNGVLEFQCIVGKLSIPALRILTLYLKEEHYSPMMGRSDTVLSLFDFDVIAPVHFIIIGGLGLRARGEDKVRDNIMKMAGKVKGFVPTLFEATTDEAAATEISSSMEDAAKAFHRISDGGNNSGVPEFKSIVGKLPIDDLRTLEKLLEVPYHGKLGSEMGISYQHEYWMPKGKGVLGGGDSFATKLAGQAIGVMVTKVAGAAVFGAFETPTTNLEPFEKAAGAVGLMSVIGGMVLQGKKPGLSRAMLKFGSVVIALGMIWSMTGNLENEIVSWIFGLLAAAIVGVTATFA